MSPLRQNPEINPGLTPTHTPTHIHKRTGGGPRSGTACRKVRTTDDRIGTIRGIKLGRCLSVNIDCQTRPLLDRYLIIVTMVANVIVIAVGIRRMIVMAGAIVVVVRMRVPTAKFPL